MPTNTAGIRTPTRHGLPRANQTAPNRIATRYNPIDAKYATITILETIDPIAPTTSQIAHSGGTSAGNVNDLGFFAASLARPHPYRASCANSAAQLRRGW